MLKDKNTFKKAFQERFKILYGTPVDEGTNLEKYKALASLVSNQISEHWYQTNKHYKHTKQVKEVYYFSIEFLLGRLLSNNLLNLGIYDIVEEGLSELGINLQDLAEQEADAGLGSGGLGRLAADFLDSMASLNLPGHGCGIRYRYGLFEQKLKQGEQVECADDWLKNGFVWEYRRPDKAVEVRFGGKVRANCVEGRTVFIHEEYETALAIPYDVPIVGYKNGLVNTLRLWSAEAPETEFDYASFQRGDYLKAVERKYSAESLSQILYPDDSFYEGRKLRLKQQYFFVSAGLQSIVRRYKKRHATLHNFPEKVALHINDTHPALVIPELMRILLDEEGMGWDEAWEITTHTVSYTNHTIMPEALEKWPIDLFKQILPRIFMIIEEINERYCQELWQKNLGMEKIRKMAIVGDGYVRMAPLAIVGSYSVNGVAKIHSEILKGQVMRDYCEVSPLKFNNKTNGITHRRWLLTANPQLGELITKTIGTNWYKNPSDLTNLLYFKDDSFFQEKFTQIKLQNKIKVADFIKERYGWEIDSNSIFDIHIKRIHAYKRQLLNALHIMYLYNRLLENPDLEITPRTFIFAGKAAPGYYLAKKTIKLINTLAEVINNDKTIQEKIKVVFLENYNVSLAELLIPSADVSEQISTASKEASGTGNMKFMMNGAVTIGTLDGANVEILERVGLENFILFGLTAEEVLNYYKYGGYYSHSLYNSKSVVKKILDQLINGFLGVPKDEFMVIYEHLLTYNDEFFVLKDLGAYIKAQERIEELYKDKVKWLKMCITNVAYSGFFSSDRTINEYSAGIWDLKPAVIKKH
ncbi:MAG TPA: glycogen/starch/alpha-glucan phosphorylase [Clostridia bacterium]|jgi:starch phosphorylase|nr:glycogen/starch/alpha-glucan phosphorylase [Clostridia bacterium]HHY05449.1 glycogen/starch/alpha-glucan phosphorylase [Clostridia bacterium]